MLPNDFIAAIEPAAHAAMLATNIPASFTIAQAAVESAWGKSQQCLQDFNYFGIKADASWHGETQMWPTREVLHNIAEIETCPFRKYPNLTAGLEDHAAFLTGNPRYAAAFEHKGDSCAFAKAVAEAGYATDPHYAEIMCSIIDKHNLKQYDVQTN
ncbi:MAG: glucosaminidase domain-containing protein [Burkholderiaceae bacterium]|nr:glucosaminidase domain-containing protein [Burkholderiaceae bacterium]